MKLTWRLIFLVLVTNINFKSFTQPYRVHKWMSDECGRNEGATWRKVKIRDCTVFLLKTSHPAPWYWSNNIVWFAKWWPLCFYELSFVTQWKPEITTCRKLGKKKNALPWCWCLKACLWWYMYFGSNHLKTRTKRCCSHPALSREKDVFAVLQIGLGKSLIALQGKVQLFKIVIMQIV